MGWEIPGHLTLSMKHCTLFFQNSGTIEHEQAPTGDLYAVAEKKPNKRNLKKNEPTEQELAAMYSVPDKTKASGVSCLLLVQIICNSYMHIASQK